KRFALFELGVLVDGENVDRSDLLDGIGQLVDFLFEGVAGLFVRRWFDVGQRVDAGVKIEGDLLAQQIECRRRTIGATLRFEQRVLCRVPTFTRCDRPRLERLDARR